MKKALAALLVFAVVLISPAMAESRIGRALNEGGSLNIVVKIDGFDGLEDCALYCDIQTTGGARTDLSVWNAGEELFGFSSGSTPDGDGVYLQTTPLGDEAIVFNGADLSKVTGNVCGFLQMMGMVSEETASDIEDAADDIGSGNGELLSKIDLSKYDLTPLEYAVEELRGRCVREVNLKSSLKYAFLAPGETAREVTITASRADAQLMVDAFRETVEINSNLPEWTKEPFNKFAELLDAFVEKLRGGLEIEIDLDADDIPTSVVAAFSLEQEDGVRTYMLDGKLECGGPLEDAEIVNPIYPGRMNLGELISTGYEKIMYAVAWFRNLAGSLGAESSIDDRYADDSSFGDYAYEDPSSEDPDYDDYMYEDPSYDDYTYGDSSSEDPSYGDFQLGDLLGGLFGGQSGDGSSDEGFSLGGLLSGLLGGQSGEDSTYGDSTYGGSSYGDSSYGGSSYGGQAGRGSTYGGSSYGDSTYGGSSYGSRSAGDSSVEGFSLGDLLGGLLGGQSGEGSSSGDFSLGDLLGSFLG